MRWLLVFWRPIDSVGVAHLRGGVPSMHISYVCIYLPSFRLFSHEYDVVYLLWPWFQEVLCSYIVIYPRNLFYFFFMPPPPSWSFVQRKYTSILSTTHAWRIHGIGLLGRNLAIIWCFTVVFSVIRRQDYDAFLFLQVPRIRPTIVSCSACVGFGTDIVYYCTNGGWTVLPGEKAATVLYCCIMYHTYVSR